MTSQSASLVSSIRAARGPLTRAVSLLSVTCALTAVSLLAQDDPNAPAAGNGRQRGQRGQNGANAGDPNAVGGRGGRGNFDPAQMQEQMMTRLREQFGVTDDAEWKLISDRIAAVNALRQAGGGAGGGFGGLGGGGRGGAGGFGGGAGGGGGRGGRGGASSPELDALRQAITDKLPDAEIKSRLARLREVRKETEEKLTKAQEDLRAVLDVRQEAVAVMSGLLP